VLFRSLVPHSLGFEVHGFLGGGETGRTLFHGWSAVNTSVSHLWAHPVDLPLVSDQTIAELRRESIRKPQILLRPEYAGEAGHPVIIPTGKISSAWSGELWREAPMREVIANELKRGHIDEERMVAVTDRGVVFDFDQPDDFDQAVDFTQD